MHLLRYWLGTQVVLCMHAFLCVYIYICLYIYKYIAIYTLLYFKGRQIALFCFSELLSIHSIPSLVSKAYKHPFNHLSVSLWSDEKEPHWAKMRKERRIHMAVPKTTSGFLIFSLRILFKGTSKYKKNCVRP